MRAPLWLYSLLPVVMLSGCVTSRPRAFTLVDYQNYRREAVPVPADSGRELLRRFCFQPPPGCEANSIACSIHPEFPGADWRYRFDLTRVKTLPRAQSQAKQVYFVNDVALETEPYRPYVVPPDKPGRVVMWRNIARDPKQRALVRDYLVKESGAATGATRLRYLDKMVEEIVWHERQHVLEGVVFNRELEKVMNSPAGYPRYVVLAPGQRPDEVLAKAVEHDRDKRIQALLKRNATCATKFHDVELKPDSYATLIAQCACYGGWACDAKLPDFDRTDFRCDEPLPGDRYATR